MNIQLLKRLYSIYSPSGKEQKMVKFLCSYIRQLSGDISVSKDKFGNLYVVKGKAEVYPCLVSHIDQVSHCKHSKDFKAVETREVIFGYSSKNRRFENLGADDKNGVFICLECLKKYDSIKVVFFREEETGCRGSSEAVMSFFDDVRFVIQPDRKGNSDLITSIGYADLCSEGFMEAIEPEKWGYMEENGLMTDILTLKEKGLEEVCALATTDWDQIAEFLFAGERKAEVRRTTKETDIYVALNLDGNGTCDIFTGLGFFDHMLEQIGKHSGMDLTIRVKGDLEVDEHHTIEDTAIALGECIYQALGSKRGIERYGYALPMDDCLCQVCLDFGGRPWLVWDAEFKREKIGEMPTEMFLHFFKSLSDAAKMNLNIKAEGQNEHHKIEGIFKALARALKMAIKRDIYHFELPSSKGVL